MEFRKNPKLNWNGNHNNGQITLQNHCVSPQQIRNLFQKLRFEKRMSCSWLTIFRNWPHLIKIPVEEVGREIDSVIILLVYSSCWGQAYLTALERHSRTSWVTQRNESWRMTHCWCCWKCSLTCLRLVEDVSRLHAVSQLQAVSHR